MINRNRDSKFVIYQVLYIFIITILALKGADINLKRVAPEDETVNINVRDSLVAILDSLYSLGIDFSIQIDPKVVEENQELKDQLASLNKRVRVLKEQIKEQPPEEIKPEEKKIVEEQTKLQSPISLKQTFIQNTWNVATNRGDVLTYIYDPKNLSTPLSQIFSS